VSTISSCNIVSSTGCTIVCEDHCDTIVVDDSKDIVILINQTSATTTTIITTSSQNVRILANNQLADIINLLQQNSTLPDKLHVPLDRPGDTATYDIRYVIQPPPQVTPQVSATTDDKQQATSTPAATNAGSSSAEQSSLTSSASSSSSSAPSQYRTKWRDNAFVTELMIRQGAAGYVTNF